MEVPVNYLAVLLAAVSTMILGFLWYGPLFGKQWTALMGWTEEEMAKGREKMKKDGWKTYGMQFLGALVMAYVFSHVLVFASAYTETGGWGAGVSCAVWMWLGFIAPVGVGSVLWDGKPWKLFFLQGGYYLVALIIMGIIIGSW